MSTRTRTGIFLIALGLHSDDDEDEGLYLRSKELMKSNDAELACVGAVSQSDLMWKREEEEGENFDHSSLT